MKRRGFLKRILSAGAGGAAMALPRPVPPDQSEALKERIKALEEQIETPLYVMDENGAEPMLDWLANGGMRLRPVVDRLFPWVSASLPPGIYGTGSYGVPGLSIPDDLVAGVMPREVFEKLPETSPSRALIAKQEYLIQARVEQMHAQLRRD